MPASLLKKLPKKAQKIYEAVYKKARAEGKSPSDAAILAIGVVKKSYKQTKTKKWVTKSTALKSTILKSGLFNKTIKFTIPLTNTKVDSEGEVVSKELIDKIYNNQLIMNLGDVEHEEIAKEENKMNLRDRLTNLKGTKGLYILEEIRKKEDDDGTTELEALITMNKQHPLYETMLKEHKQGRYLYASAEFKGAKQKGNKIVDADMLGWTITNLPINYYTKANEVFAS